jgi:DNA-binding IclR family transcriptional regulator
MSDLTLENVRDAGIKSVVVGARLLHAIASAPGPQTLTKLASEAGMPTAKARRYLVGYIQAGLATQDPVSHLYDFGPAALQLGLSAVARFDVVKRAEPVLQRLSQQMDETVGLMIWSPGGPMLARLIVSNHPIALTMRVGSILPLLSSASGHVLGAYLEEGTCSYLIAKEKKQSPSLKAMSEGKIFATVRKQGYARVDGSLLTGVTAFAVPVFGPLGEITAALFVLGRTDAFNPAKGQKVVKSLLESSKAVSASAA